MSEIFNKAVEQADKLSTQDNAGSVLDALYGKTEEAYEKFEKQPLLEQLALSMTPGIGNVIAAKEVDVFGGRAGEAFEKDEWGKAAGYGGLTALAALGTLPGVGLIGRGAKGAIRGGLKLLDDPMEQAIEEVGKKATLPKPSSRVFGKELDEYTGPHSDFVRQGDIVERSGLADPKIMNKWKEEVKLKKAERVKELDYDPSVLPKNILDKATEYSKLRPKTDDEALQAFEEWRSFIHNPSNFNVVRPILKMPEGFTPSNETIARALSKDGKLNKPILNETKVKIFDKKGNHELMDQIPEDTAISARLDIPSYNNKDTWIVTLHDGLNPQGGSVTGYSSTAKLTDVNFKTSPDVALKIARKAVLKVDEKTGKPIKRMSKSTIARMNGKWKNHEVGDVQKQAKNILNSFDEKAGKFIVDGEEWVQVGMNPYRHSFFYDKVTMQPIKSADEVIQLGPLVLAKKVKYDNLLNYKTNEGLIFKQGGQIATGLAGLGENIVYRQDRGQVGMSGMGFDQLLSDDPDVQAANYSQYSTQQPPREDQSDDGWYEDVIIDYENKAIYADPLERTPANPEHIDEGNLVSLATKVGLYDPNNPDATPRNVLYHLLFNTPAGRASLNNNMVNREGGFISKKGEKDKEHLVDVYYLQEGYDNDDLAIIQSAINDGKLQGIGIEFANTMEHANKLTEKQGYEGEDLNNLNTFGKNMRSSMEAWSTGDGLSRDDYDPGILVGTAKYTDVVSERKKALAAEAFTGMLTDAERGETVGDIYQQYFQRYGTTPPAASFGYNENSNAQARDVAGAIDEARGKGMMQGLGMLIAPGMTTLPSILTAGYETGKDGISKNMDVFDRMLDKVKEKALPYIPEYFTKKPPVSSAQEYVEKFSPLDKQSEQGESLLEKSGTWIGEGAKIGEWITDPVGTGIRSLLTKGGKSFGFKSVPNYSSSKDAAAAREKSLSEDPTWRDRIRDFLPDFGPTPLPSANVYGGENVTEAIQFPSTEIASLPVALEEQKEQKDFGGAMLAALTAPKPPQQNRNKQFIDYLYSTNNIFT